MCVRPFVRLSRFRPTCLCVFVLLSVRHIFDPRKKKACIACYSSSIIIFLKHFCKNKLTWHSHSQKQEGLLLSKIWRVCTSMTYLLTPVPCSGLEVKVRSWNVGSEQLSDTFTGYKFAAVACWARALGCKRTLDTGAPASPPSPQPARWSPWPASASGSSPGWWWAPPTTGPSWPGAPGRGHRSAATQH